MIRLIVIGAAAAAAVAVPAAALAAPAGPTKVPLVNDCGNGSINGDCLALDMIGTFAGVVKFRHKNNGNLRLMIVVKEAPKNMPYQLEIFCGASPAKAGTLVGALAEAVVTDTLGAATAGPFEVPAADLKETCGKGALGHLQLINIASGSILSAGPIQMTA